MGQQSPGPSEAVAPTEIVGGRYRIDRPLGTGGMAEVFVATDLRLRRTVALKRIPATVSPDATARARMAREARALARVNHPNVVTVFDIVEDDGRPFLVMELVEGETLRHVLDREGSLRPARAIAIACEIASGLAAAHAQGIVHRDLKPSNILLSSSGTVKIGDFGIARMATDARLTRTGEVFGSPPYVSPEQLVGAPVDARADLYALGCVLFETLAGRPPFLGDDPVSLTYQHVHAEPVLVDVLVPGIRPELAAVVHRLLAKDPKDRPRSADEVRGELTRMPAPAAPHDTPTARLDRTPTAPLPLVSPNRAARMPNDRSWLLWAIGIALVAVILVASNAMMDGSDVARSGQRRTHASSPAQPATGSPASPSPSSQSPVRAAVTPSEAGQTLVDLARQLEGTGELSGDLVKDVDHGVDDALRELENGDQDKAAEEVDKLRDRVGEALEHGDVSSEGAQSLDAAIDELASAIDTSRFPGAGDEGDEGD
jgi:serine/threonine-protein kinase